MESGWERDVEVHKGWDLCLCGGGGRSCGGVVVVVGGGVDCGYGGDGGGGGGVDGSSGKSGLKFLGWKIFI